MKPWGTIVGGMRGERWLLAGAALLVLIGATRGFSAWTPTALPGALGGALLGIQLCRWLDSLRLRWDEREAMEAEYGPFRKPPPP